MLTQMKGPPRGHAPWQGWKKELRDIALATGALIVFFGVLIFFLCRA